MGNEKVPLVLFSGGLDSTYYLYKLLKETDVEILYIKGNQGDVKITAELKARENIIEWLSKKMKFKIRQSFIEDLSSASITRNYKFGQITPWLFGALNVVDSNIHSNVDISYVMKDDINEFIPNIKTAWDNLSYTIHSNPITLRFPLSLYKKQDILNDIPVKLYNLTWVCELPKATNVKYSDNIITVEKNVDGGYRKLRPCNNCSACISRKVEEYKYKLLNKRSFKDK